MYIVCPKCNSYYKILESLLGIDGRTVRCANCENTWFQSPEEPAEMEDLENVEIIDMVSGQKVDYIEEETPSKETPPKEENIGTPIAEEPIDDSSDEQSDEVESSPDSEVVEDSAENSVEEPEENITIDLDPIEDEVNIKDRDYSDDVNTVQVDDAPKEEAPAEDLPITHPSEDIVNQVQSILGNDASPSNDKKEEEYISTDAVFSRINQTQEELQRKKEQESNKTEESEEKYAELPFDFEKSKQPFIDMPEDKKKKYATLFGYLALIIFFIIFFTARYQIAKTFRFTRPIYELFNVDAVIPGEELELINITRRSYEIDFERKMEISGFVFNPTEDIQDLPIITAELLDEDTNYLQDKEVELEQLEIKAKERIGFNIVITTPARNAKYAIVTFKKRPKIED